MTTTRATGARQKSSSGHLKHRWVEPHRVHRNAYLDQKLFEEELDKIFSQTWIYVGHESEVAQPGDYRTSVIGRQPVIVVRDENHDLHVLMNRCTHRAATICQAANGNSAFFRCEYHGWTFRNNGELVAPTFRAGYDPADFVDRDYDLAKAPRVDTYRGFIFARLSANGPTLREHLGRAIEFIDLALDLSPAGTIRCGAGTHRYAYRGNWKLQAENGVDGYHPNFVHRAFLETSGLADLGMFGPNSSGRAGSLGGGHALLDFRSAMAPLMKQRLATAEGQRAIDQLAERLGDRERANEVFMANGTQGLNILIFPNLLIIGAQLRVIHPRDVDLTEVDVHPYLLDGASDEENIARLHMHEEFYGSAGGGSPDDVEIFGRVAAGLAVQSVEWLPMTRGLRREEIDGEARWGHMTDEQPQRGFYQRWLELMT